MDWIAVHSDYDWLRLATKTENSQWVRTSICCSVLCGTANPNLHTCILSIFWLSWVHWTMDVALYTITTINWTCSRTSSSPLDTVHRYGWMGYSCALGYRPNSHIMRINDLSLLTYAVESFCEHHAQNVAVQTNNSSMSSHLDVNRFNRQL